MPKHEAPTLADALIREYARSSDVMGTHTFINMVSNARRFVLDDTMSEFMTDLAYASLPMFRDAKRDNMFLESRRILARLPYPVTWVEFNMRARSRRAVTEYGIAFPEYELPAKCGWLLLQHERVDTAFMAIECASHTVRTTGDGASLQAVPSPLPIAWVWSSDDSLPPWQALPTRHNVAALLTGINTYNTDKLTACHAPFLDKQYHSTIDKITDATLVEMASDVRYLWAFLAALNDTPVSMRDVVPRDKYLSKGRMRPYLRHTVISLNIPGHGMSMRKLAQKVCIASRRRAHEVRGHWRADWRKPGERIWVHAHIRGDASLGFVTHDYAVKHEEDHNVS